MPASRPKLLTRLAAIGNLPSLPEVVLRLESVLNSPASSASDVVAVLETDPALVARLLKVANSAYYRFGANSVASTQQAVTRLGFREVRKLCLALAALRLSLRPSLSIDHRDLWRHSLTVASIARELAEQAAPGEVNPDEAFTGGLLHEIGCLILDQFFGQIYGPILQETRRCQCPIHLIENKFLQTSHAQVGAYLLERWKLPAPLVSAVGGHHDPEAADLAHRPLCRVVHLADRVCSAHQVHGPGEEYLPKPDIKALGALGLTRDAARMLLKRVEEEAARSSRFISAAA